MTFDHVNLMRIRIASEIEYICAHQCHHTNRITTLIDSLSQLMNAIVAVPFNAADKKQVEEVLKQLGTIENVLEYIKHTSTSNLFGEVFSCLRIALEEWCDDSDNYVMVTGPGSFAFTYFKPDYELEVIKTKYMIPFPVMPVQFNLPSHLEHDFLGNVSLYHELGHFVDSLKSFSDSAYNAYITDKTTLTDKEKQFFLNDFAGNPQPPKDDMTRAYFSEYFADLFAAQYLSAAHIYALNLKAFKNPFSDDHPSTDSRVALVETFLKNSGEGLALVQLFKNAVQKVTNNAKQLSNKSYLPDMTPLKKSQPCVISKDEELHGIFIAGWRAWLNKNSYFMDTKGKPLDDLTAYKLLRKLIKQSISDYISKR